MSWVLIFYTVTGKIDVHEFKHVRDCNYVMMIYYHSPYKFNFRCEYRHGKEQ